MKALIPFVLVVGSSSLGVARSVTAKEPSRGELIAGCVESREKSFECKDPFIDAMIDLRLSRSGKTVTTEEREKMKAQGMAEITEDGSGPLPPRRAKCAALVDQMTSAGRSIRPSIHADLKACYKKTDCRQRVHCMMPLFAELMFGK